MIFIRQGKIEDFKKLGWGWEGIEHLQEDVIKRIQKGDQEFWVIEKDDEKLIGELHILWKHPDPEHADGKKRAYLSGLRIQEQYRHRGYGTRLTERAIERIKEKGFKEVTIGAYPLLEELYRKWGFTEFIKEAVEERIEGKPTYKLLLKRLD